MTFRIGVLPAQSRNTPTPTSIFSGLGSALHRAISWSSESLLTGGKSARRRALALVSVSMAKRLATSCVVIHRDAVADRHRLAGQHIARSDFLIGETVARGHLDLALGHFRAARRADAGFACERR